MSGAEVIGVIAGVISVVDASIKVYDGVKKDVKLDEAFHTVGQRLPVLRDTLQTCNEHLAPIKDSLDEDVCEALESVAEACDERARQLDEIFDKCLPLEADKRETRYRKLLNRPGKGKKVEELMLFITEDVRLLVNHHAVKAASSQQLAQLSKIVEEMKSLPSSAAEPLNPIQPVHSGSGAQETHVHSGNGPHVERSIGSIGHYFETHGPLHYATTIIEPTEDFSFHEPKGLCLDRYPHIDPGLFVGRESEIEAIKNALATGGSRLVLGGIGGIGKTQLAIAYAKRCQELYTSVFWLNAESDATIRVSYRKMAELIFTVSKPAALDGEQSISHVRRWFSDSRNTQWLLIFDNYDEPKAYAIEDYIPPTSQGSIIITTRQPEHVAGIYMQVQPLSDVQDSLEILRSRSKRSKTSEDPFAKQLAKRLDGLPLALVTAGAYLSRVPMTFERYLEEYERHWNVSPQWAPHTPEYRNGTLYTTWAISYARLQHDQPNAAKLLQLLAFFSHQSVRYEDLSAGYCLTCSSEWMQYVLSEDRQLYGLMAILVGYCFVDPDSEAGGWAMHTCVHDWTLAVLNESIDPSFYWHAFDCVAALIRGHNNEYKLAAFSRLANHATQLVRALMRRQPHDYKLSTNQRPIDFATEPQMDHFVKDGLLSTTVRGLNDAENMIVLLSKHDQNVLAMQLTSRILAATERALGSGHVSSLRFALLLAQTYHDQDKLDLAEQVYKRVLSESEERLGPDHDVTLGAVHRIGGLYFEQKRPDDAEEMVLRVLTVREKASGPDHNSTLELGDNLGSIYQAQGKLEKAEQMFSRVLAERQRTLGSDHLSTLDTMSNLGIVYQKQGRLNKYESMYLQILAGREKALGPDRLATLDTLEGLAHFYRNQRELEKASSMFLRLLNGRLNALGPHHCKTLGTLYELGVVYHMQNDIVKAEEMLLQALTGQEQTLECHDVEILHTKYALGDLYNRPPAHTAVRAEPMYLEALTGFNKVLGTDHVKTLTVAHDLGRLYDNLGRSSEADQTLSRALDGKCSTLGKDHESTLGTVRLLAHVYRKTQMVTKAIELVFRWGPKHKFLYGILGRTLLKSSDDTNAREAFQHQYALQNGTTSQIVCDRCNCVITAATGRHVCRDCPDVDYCGACFTKFKAEISKKPLPGAHCFEEILFEEAGAEAEAEAEAVGDADADADAEEERNLLKEVLATSWLEHLAIVTGAQLEELHV